ncbi:MAG: hypothetical protein J7603_17110, partial [Pseudacidovorax sp.]|nr:hypothetical protein [Pseudacidovorax sp.]
MPTKSKSPAPRRGRTAETTNAKIEQLAGSTAELPLPHLSTNQGTRIADNHNSLKAGVRGPTLLED